MGMPRCCIGEWQKTGEKHNPDDEPEQRLRIGERQKTGEKHKEILASDRYFPYLCRQEEYQKTCHEAAKSGPQHCRALSTKAHPSFHELLFAPPSPYCLYQTALPCYIDSYLFSCSSYSRSWAAPQVRMPISSVIRGRNGLSWRVRYNLTRNGMSR